MLFIFFLEVSKIQCGEPGLLNIILAPPKNMPPCKNSAIYLIYWAIYMLFIFFLEVAKIQCGARFPISLTTPIPTPYLSYLPHIIPTPFLPHTGCPTEKFTSFERQFLGPLKSLRNCSILETNLWISPFKRIMPWSYWMLIARDFRILTKYSRFLGLRAPNFYMKKM